jgi:hypothetical protein
VTVTKNASGQITVGWTQQANTVHDVIRGTYTALQQGELPSGAACRSSNTTAAAYNESGFAGCSDPRGCWYVVRAQTLCGNGTWGSSYLDSHLGGVCPAGCAPVANCNDNNTCTTGDSCGANDVCQYIPVSCNDSNACTTDRCINQLGCFHTPVNCNDNNLCTSDVCFQTIGCVHVLTICDDGNPCTNDFCDPQTGDCEHNRPFVTAGGGSLRAEEGPEDASRSDADGPGGPAPVKAERPWSYDDLDSLPTIDFLSSDDGPATADYVAIFGNDFGARASEVTIPWQRRV